MDVYGVFYASQNNLKITSDMEYSEFAGEVSAIISFEDISDEEKLEMIKKAYDRLKSKHTWAIIASGI